MALNNQFKVKNDFNSLGRILSAGVDIADIFAASNTSFTLSGYNTTFLVPGNSTVSFQGGNGIDVRATSSTRTIVASGINATNTVRGVASFNTASFDVAAGDVTIKPGGVTNTQLAGSIEDSKLLPLTASGKVANSATTATSNNTANFIVARGASGEFSSGSITATGNLSASQTVTGNILNAATGFRINNGATSGHFLRGNGTNFVSSPLVVSDIGSGQALTSSTNNNVTITLEGAPTVALLSAVNLNVGWTGQLEVSRGGTGSNNGSITGTGALTFAAGGTNQNINLTPSGTGSVNITKGNVTSGLTVAGNSTFSGTLSSSGAIDTGAGFRVGGTATSGHVLRGNGTNFVSSTLAASDIASGQALTKVDDPNITLTLGGSPTNALLNATSITVAFSGILPVTRGGTGSNNGSIAGSGALTFTAGGSNQDITLSPSGAGEVNISKVDIDSGTIDGVSIGSATAATIVNVDNLRLDSNVISSLNSTNISLQPATGTTTATGNLSASQTVTGNVVNGVTGFRVNNAATSGHVLRGNGTNFVSSTLAASDIASGQALTSSNGTNNNVTLTLSGSPNSALLAGVGLTLGWTGLLAVSRGGTGSNNGSITGTGALTFAAGGSNQDINLNPSGTGEVNISKVDIDGGAIDGTPIGASSPSTGRFTSLAATGNVNIDGSLFVAGSAITIDAANITTKDPLIYLAQGNAGDAVDIGFVGQYTATGTKFTGLVRDTSTSKWNLFSGLSAHPLSATDIIFTNPSISRDTLIANIEGNVTGNLTGVASSATQLATGRTISLTGDVSYTSPSFNGTQDVTGTATIANSAVNSDKILNGAVTTVKIADSAVTTAKVVNGAITYEKFQTIPANTILGNDTNTNPGAITFITCTAQGRNLIAEASAAGQRTVLGLGSTDSVTFGDVTVNNGSRTVLRDVYSGTTGAGATTQTLNLFADASYNSAKIHVQIKQGTGGTAKRCALEILMTRDNGSWEGTVYAIVDPSGIFQNVTNNVDAGTLQLLFNYIGSNVYTATASVEAISD